MYIQGHNLDTPLGKEDAESDGTEGSERMKHTRGLCSEGEGSSQSEDGSEDGDDSDDGDLFLSDASSSDSEPADLPTPTAAGYLFLDPDNLRSKFARVTEFRGQKSCRCYKHPQCSWLLPFGSRIPQENQIRWALAGLKPEVVTKADHMKLRAAFGDTTS